MFAVSWPTCWRSMPAAQAPSGNDIFNACECLHRANITLNVCCCCCLLSCHVLASCSMPTDSKAAKIWLQYLSKAEYQGCGHVRLMLYK
jgi:hypothetical protein